MDTPEQLAEKRERLEKQRKCPVCGARRERERFMTRFEDEIARFIRENDLAKRESCLFCVEKHVGKALVLFREIESVRTANGDADGNADGNAGGGAVNVMLNHLEIVGNLQAAADEAVRWPELWRMILDAEHNYRYEGLAPEWGKIAQTIQKTKQTEGNHG